MPASRRSSKPPDRSPGEDDGAAITPRRHFRFVDASYRRLFVPDAFVQGFGLVLEQRPDHLGWSLSAPENFAAGQVERGGFRVIAGDGAQPMLTQAVDQ